MNNLKYLTMTTFAESSSTFDKLDFSTTFTITNNTCTHSEESISSNCVSTEASPRYGDRSTLFTDVTPCHQRKINHEYLSDNFTLSLNKCSNDISEYEFPRTKRRGLRRLRAICVESTA